MAPSPVSDIQPFQLSDLPSVGRLQTSDFSSVSCLLSLQTSNIGHRTSDFPLFSFHFILSKLPTATYLRQASCSLRMFPQISGLPLRLWRIAVTVKTSDIGHPTPDIQPFSFQLSDLPPVGRLHTSDFSSVSCLPSLQTSDI